MRHMNLYLCIQGACMIHVALNKPQQFQARVSTGLKIKLCTKCASGRSHGKWSHKVCAFFSLNIYLKIQRMDGKEFCLILTFL